jgi:hypothetical protein
MDILGKHKKDYVSEYHIPTEVYEELEKKESVKEIKKIQPEKSENKPTPNEPQNETITPQLIKSDNTEKNESHKIENHLIVSNVNTSNDNKKINENSMVEKREDTVEDEEIKNYISSLENNKAAQGKEDKTLKKDYDKEDLKKLEDSINDDANNNYDVNFDDYFGNEIAKEKDAVKNQNQEIIQPAVINEIPSKSVEVKHKKVEKVEKVETIKKSTLEISKTKPVVARNQVLANNLKKEDSMPTQSNNNTTSGNKIVMKKISILSNDKGMSRTQDFKEQVDLNTPKTSPMKSKISFYSLKTKDQHNPMNLKEESISPYSKFNKTGYLYLKENKLSLEKSLKAKLLNKSPSNIHESSKVQVEEYKKKKVSEKRNIININDIYNCFL